MDKIKYITNVALLSTMSFVLAPPALAASDVYDILRGNGTADGGKGVTLNDLQAMDSAMQAAQANQDSQLAKNNPQPDLPVTKPTTLREEAFKELMNKTFPLKPEQIKELHKEHDKSVAAINSSPNTPPQPVSSTVTVDLSPGATPPIIRLATGFVTSIVFIDSTGQPWPVSDYSLGNPTGFNIKWDNKTNALFIQSTKDHITGNMAVRLADLETPIMIFIVTGQKDVDYRVDLQVPGNGPNALAPVLDNNTPQTASPALLSALDGVPPVGSVELNVAKDYGRAWSYNGKLLFRTKLTLLSPAWSASVSGPDGTKVYELVQTPLILASQNGKTIKIELTGL